MTLIFDRLFEVYHMVANPNPKKRFTKKHLIFSCQKISALALHTESRELSLALPVKSRKFNWKINFFEKFYKKKPYSKNDQNKILYKMAQNIDTYFWLLKFLISNRPQRKVPDFFLSSLKIIFMIHTRWL